jgi:hypothetical protein
LKQAVCSLGVGVLLSKNKLTVKIAVLDVFTVGGTRTHSMHQEPLKNDRSFAAC